MSAMISATVPLRSQASPSKVSEIAQKWKLIITGLKVWSSAHFFKAMISSNFRIYWNSFKGAGFILNDNAN